MVKSFSLSMSSIPSWALGSGIDSTLDAANILKPALARGTLRTVGATTQEEYQKHIEKDAALSRRFAKVTIEEPSVADSMTICKA